MCGILSIFSGPGNLRAETLERAIEKLAHRGPDGRRVWLSPDRRVGLGHARLSIIDLTTGDQPIANEDETLHIVVNGEFYGYEKIQQDLERRGHRLRTRSDSEIALHLYEEVGTQCLHQLRGEFAFVIWDGPNKTLFAARDRFGIKPLFYAQVGDTLYLASEVKALLAAGVPAAWDREAFFQTCYTYLEDDRSLFQGIYQIPPGHYLLATPYNFRIVPYWDFDYPKATDAAPLIRPEEYVERLRHVLGEAVRLRLRADVPVGCYLSGGIDSASVIGLAATHTSEPIDAFSICFDAEAYNEEKAARETAERVGARFHPLHITGDDLADHFEDAVYYGEITPNNENGIAKYLLSKLVRDKGHKVVLTGDGADEIFAGYPHFRRDLILYNSERQDPAVVERLIEQLHDANRVSSGIQFPVGPPLPMEGVKQTLGFVPSWMESFSALGVRLGTFFSPAFRAEFAGRDPYRVFLNRMDVRNQLAGREPVNQSLYLWSKTMLPNYMLNWTGDRMEMAHSVEGRLPLLDHEVVELVRQMPVAMKIQGTVEKHVLREAVRPLITESVYRRQKHPFLAPPSSLRPQARLHEMVQDVLRGPLAAALPFFDQAEVVKYLDRLPTEDEQQRSIWSFPLMRIVTACFLQKRFQL